MNTICPICSNEDAIQKVSAVTIDKTKQLQEVYQNYRGQLYDALDEVITGVSDDGFHTWKRSADSMTAKAFGNPSSMMTSTNRREWQQADILSANGTGNARSLARFWQLLAHDGRLDGVSLLDATPIFPLGRKIRTFFWNTGMMAGE